MERVRNAELSSSLGSDMNDVRTGPAADGPAIEVVPLGGLGEFGLNTMAITCGDSTIVVDAGAMFPVRSCRASI